MAYLVTVPQAGQTMEEATVDAWYKEVGDPIEIGDVLVDVHSDKAVVSVESFYVGTLRERLVSTGDLVRVLDPVAVVAQSGEEYDLPGLIEKHEEWVKANAWHLFEGG